MSSDGQGYAYTEVQAQERVNGRGGILLFALLFALSNILIIKCLDIKDHY
jgi:hypothetical protein